MFQFNCSIYSICVIALLVQFDVKVLSKSSRYHMQVISVVKIGMLINYMNV